MRGWRKQTGCGSRFPPTPAPWTRTSAYRARRALLAVLACTSLQFACAAASGADAAVEAVEMLVQVDLNQQGLNETVIVLRAGARLLIAAEDLRRWRLRTPDAAPYSREGRTYFPLGALPGVQYRLDEARQTLAITTGPEAFIETVSTLPGSPASTAILPQPGVFLNYAVSIVDTEEFTT